MTLDALRKLLKRVPFKAFEIVMSNGERYVVEHPENCILAREFALVMRRPDGSDVVEDFDYLSYLHIASAEPLSARAR